MLRPNADRLRFLLHDALASKRGDRLRAVRLARELLGTANDLAGRPLCSPEELARRRRSDAPIVGQARREPAPVVVYVDGNHPREQRRIEELLAAAGLPFRVLDLTDDEATRSWAFAQSRRSELPLVFIAGEPVGGFEELTQLDVNGQLKRRVLG